MGRKRKRVPPEGYIRIKKWDGFAAETWNVFELALGYGIKPELRDEVEEVTFQYFAHLQAERSPASDDVLDVLSKIEALSSKLLEELRSPSVEQHYDYQSVELITGDWDERHYALTYILRNLRAKSFRAARETLDDLVEGCNKARQQLEGLDYMGWQTGDAWRLTVGRIALKFKQAGLPSSASRNVIASSAPFVRFVAAWQSALPPECRRHTHSDEALASAITRVWQIFIQSNPENAT